PGPRTRPDQDRAGAPVETAARRWARRSAGAARRALGTGRRGPLRPWSTSSCHRLTLRTDRRMKSRVVWIAGAAFGALALAGVAWYSLVWSSDTASREAFALPEETRAEPAPLAIPADTAPPEPLPPPAIELDTADLPGLDAAGAATPASDEAAVLSMYQNMADAVDAYGDACSALGQAFRMFVSDGAPATSRLIAAHKAKGEDFTAWFEGAHHAQLEPMKAKVKDAIGRCGNDPGVRQALTALSKLN